MNFNHLEYALAVAKYGSISKASQNLFMSQPYLSSMIKNLEAEVGYQIFDRTSSGIVLTKEGEQFMKSARIILLELKKMKELNTGGEEKQLNISCYYATFIMEMFLKFCNAPRTSCQIRLRRWEMKRSWNPFLPVKVRWASYSTLRKNRISMKLWQKSTVSI